jgi:hypothetical protein
MGKMLENRKCMAGKVRLHEPLFLKRGWGDLETLSGLAITIICV